MPIINKLQLFRNCVKLYYLSLSLSLSLSLFLSLLSIEAWNIFSIIRKRLDHFLAELCTHMNRHNGKIAQISVTTSLKKPSLAPSWGRFLKTSYFAIPHSPFAVQPTFDWIFQVKID